MQITTLLVVLAFGGLNYLRAQDAICGNFRFWNTQKCFNCPGGCRTCTSFTTCTDTCDADAQEVEGQCLEFPSGCKTASFEAPGKWECSACSDGYQLIQGICVRAFVSSQVSTSDYTEGRFSVQQNYGSNQYDHWGCGKYNETSLHCDQCPEGSFRTQNGLCGSCSVFCKVCDHPDLCKTCEDGYYIQENEAGSTFKLECDRCSFPAATCSDASTALSCFDGYYLNGSTCTQCSNNCNKCTGASACTSCRNGFYLNNGACTACSANCDQCDATKCTKCEDERYYLFNGSCNSCSSKLTNSQLCTNSDTTKDEPKIKSCTSNYFLHSGECKLGPNNCYLISDTNVCQQCLDGYDKSADGSTCTPKATTSCNNQCKSQACDTATPNVCTACDEGRRLNAGNCEACNVNNCANCDADVTKCTKCQSNYGLYQQYTTTAQECRRCPSYCTACTFSSTSFKCTACNTGYFLVDGSCQQGQALCSKNSDDGKTCLQCVYGTVLYNGMCVPKLDFLGQYVVGVNAGFTDEQLECIQDLLDDNAQMYKLFGILALIILSFIQ